MEHYRGVLYDGAEYPKKGFALMIISFSRWLWRFQYDSIRAVMVGVLFLASVLGPVAVGAQVESGQTSTSIHTAATQTADGPDSGTASTSAPSMTGVRGSTFAKGSINLVIIKGGDINVVIAGQDSDAFDVETTGLPAVSKNKSVLIIKPSEQNTIHGAIRVPHGTRVVLQGASTHIQLDNLIGELDVRSGAITLTGHGRLSKLSVRAGQAKIRVRGIMGTTDLDCGDGHIDLVYVKEKTEKMDDALIAAPQDLSGEGQKSHASPSGLLLHQPAIRIKIHLAKGRATLYFPAQSTIRYPKEVANIQSSIPYAAKRPAYMLSAYLSASAELLLRSAQDFDPTPQP